MDLHSSVDIVVCLLMFSGKGISALLCLSQLQVVDMFFLGNTR